MDKCSWEDEKPRIYNSLSESNSTVSLTHISKKIRRGSFFLYWDPALDITPRLARMEKSRLCLSQNQFSALEYQLYSSRCLKVKKDRVYTYAALIVEFNNDVYIKLIRYLSVWNVLHLCIWRHHNKTMTMPSDELVALFERSYHVQSSDKKLVIKQTQIKINKKYTLRRVFWTAHQRQAAANTRDHFLYGFEVKEPMLSDLLWTQSNNEMVREFIMGLLKAEVDVAIIKDICYAQLQPKVVESDTSLQKTKQEAAVQRMSITTFEPVKRETLAAVKIQRAYCKRLAKKRAAVRQVEAWWEPFRLETEELRLELAEEQDEVARQIQEGQDLFEYNDLVQEIKDDYKTISRPEPRPPSYWVKVVMILAVPLFLSMLVNTVPYVALMIILYVVGQLLTQYRKVWYVTWIQTLGLWTWTTILMNTAFVKNGWIRIPVWVAIVAFGKHRWMMVFFASLLIRIGLSFVYDAFSIQPTEYGIFAYDVYCVATIAAASRQGTPIHMLQKVMINVIFLFIIVAGGGMAWIMVCLTGDQV